MGGLDCSTRLVLLCSRSPHQSPIFYKDSDPLMFSEIAEFAMSLATPPKGQEPFHSTPHLQVYKLIRGTFLAEIGQVDLAKRYINVNVISFIYSVHLAGIAKLLPLFWGETHHISRHLLWSNSEGSLID